MVGFRTENGGCQLCVVDTNNRVGSIKIEVGSEIGVLQERWIQTDFDHIYCFMFYQNIFIAEYGELSVLKDGKEGLENQIFDFGVKIISLQKVNDSIFVFLENGKFYKVTQEEKGYAKREFESGMGKLISASFSKNKAVLAIAGSKESFEEKFKIKVMITPEFTLNGENSDKVAHLISDSLQLLTKKRGDYSDILCALGKQGLIPFLVDYIDKTFQKKYVSQKNSLLDLLTKDIGLTRVDLKLALFAFYLNLLYHSESALVSAAQGKQLKSKFVKKFLANHSMKTGSPSKMNRWMSPELEEVQWPPNSSTTSKKSLDYCTMVISSEDGQQAAVDPWTGEISETGDFGGFCLDCNIMQSSEKCFLCFKQLTKFDKLI